MPDGITGSNLNSYSQNEGKMYGGSSGASESASTTGRGTQSIKPTVNTGQRGGAPNPINNPAPSKQSAIAPTVVTGQRGGAANPASKTTQATQSTGSKNSGDSAFQKAKSFIMGAEAVMTKAYWDKFSNGKDGRWAIAAGNSTWIDSNGVEHTVTKDTVITPADAQRTIDTKLKQYMADTKAQIGDAAWNKLNDNQKAVLTSIDWNYGTITTKTGLAASIKSGLSTEQVANQIAGLPANHSRRLKEAKLYMGIGSIKVPTQVASNSDAATVIKKSVAAGANVVAGNNPITGLITDEVQQLFKSNPTIKAFSGAGIDFMTGDVLGGVGALTHSIPILSNFVASFQNKIGNFMAPQGTTPATTDQTAHGDAFSTVKSIIGDIPFIPATALAPASAFANAFSSFMPKGIVQGGASASDSASTTGHLPASSLMPSFITGQRGGAANPLANATSSSVSTSSSASASVSWTTLALLGGAGLIAIMILIFSIASAFKGSTHISMETVPA